MDKYQIIFIMCLIIAFILYYVIPAILYRKTCYYESVKKPYFMIMLNKGRYGEYLTYRKLKSYEKKGAKFLFNCYLPKDKGETTEIDVLMIHNSGVYAFESKNYSGWIFGSEDSQNWTQTLPNGKNVRKEHFLNPIIQNKVHIKWLQTQIGVDIPVFSIIVFSERCSLKKIELKSKDIAVVKRNRVKGAVDKYNRNNSSKLSDEKVASLYEKLYPYTQVSDAVKRHHIKTIKKNYK